MAACWPRPPSIAYLPKTEAGSAVYTIDWSAISDDRDIKLWETETGRLVESLRGHLAPIRVMAFSPDSRFLASGGTDNVIKLWAVGNVLSPKNDSP